ncbi:hypothetical protein ILYODFUR_032700 [Ilyodon furcidens]|uniref:Uncharacterized protein n=1 Tax=Ilyodon furcidens TaxID=33524 RepID=A0ABV0TNQ0_9TELE
MSLCQFFSHAPEQSVVLAERTACRAASFWRPPLFLRALAKPCADTPQARLKSPDGASTCSMLPDGTSTCSMPPDGASTCFLLPNSTSTWSILPTDFALIH